MAHRLENLKRPPGGPKWPTTSETGSNPKFSALLSKIFDQSREKVATEKYGEKYDKMVKIPD